jgi:hypothetical protein
LIASPTRAPGCAGTASIRQACTQGGGQENSCRSRQIAPEQLKPLGGGTASWSRSCSSAPACSPNFQWGDAAALRLEKKQFEDQIVDLKNQRETLSTRIAREQRDKEVCRKELAEVKKGAPAAAAPAPGGVVVE